MSRRPGDPAAQLADAVRQANPVVALLGTNVLAVSAAADGCLALLSDDPIRVVRVRGLPGTPLTLPRIVEEIGANHRGGPQADDDELIVRVLATRARGESQVVLLLEQAELLPLPTLAFLQVALTVFGTRTPRLQLVFAGHPKFLHLIDREELTPLRDRLAPVIRVQTPLAGPEPGAAMPKRAELGETAAKRHIVAGPSRRRWVFAAGPVVVLAAVATTVGMNWHSAARRPIQAVTAPAPPAQSDPPPVQALTGDAQPPPMPALPPQAAEPEAAPAPFSPETDVTTAPFAPPPGREPDAAAPPTLPPPSREPDVAVLPAAPPPPLPERRALPSSEQLARLRSEFDRFLSQTEWGSKKLSENERSRLFNEYLRWNYGTLAATPGTPP